MTSHVQSLVNIGKKFLEDTETYLRRNIHRLRCNDIHNAYSGFFDVLKEFKGNSNGFTGLSEYLIFRFLYYLMGTFDRERVHWSTGFQFVSKSDRNFRIGQSLRICIGSKRFYPDIAILDKDELIAVIQIKIFLVQGSKEIDKELEKLEQLRRKYKKMKALLIIFSGPATKGKLFDKLRKLQKGSEWFDFLVLKGNSALLEEELQRHLLTKIISRKDK